MRRAFLIQLLQTRPGDQCHGRIEHVDSGRSSHFCTLSEAVSFVRDIESALREKVDRTGAITEQDVADAIQDDLTEGLHSGTRASNSQIDRN